LLVIDLSEDFVTYGINNAGSCISDIPSDEVWNDIDKPDLKIKNSISLKPNQLPEKLIFSLPIKALSYQVITLPDDLSEKERLTLLGLELNERIFSKNFAYLRLDVTQRLENDERVCDYMLIAPKLTVISSLKKLASTLSYKKFKVVPSFFFASPQNSSSLTASALLTETKTELVIWGRANPLALTSIINTGDQMGDINRFILEYFDHVQDLQISKIYLYGQRMKDASITYSLNYPYEIIDEPETFIARSLPMADLLDDIYKVARLPKAPISLTPRNLILAGSLLAILFIVLAGTFLQFNNIRLERDLRIFQNKAEKNKKLSIEKKQLEKETMELDTEKNFYLSITKRRTPWYLILTDLSKQSPPELWFERLNSNQREILISGKAKSTKDVSDFSINLENNSVYFKDPKIIGTRDYEGETRTTYAEFQITAQLKSASGLFVLR
jgi:Tfp pilus assembly protein PilN